jgi:hypothetical protein
MNYFVIQCYGKERILREAKFCVLSLLKFIHGKENYKIVLYTDNSAFFEDIKEFVVCEPLLPATVQQWKGEHNFVHRVKIMMLLEFSAKYNGKFIYLDSDTWFKQSPAELFTQIDEGNALMHLPEAQLKSNANPIIKKIHRFVKANAFTLANGETVSIPPDYFMWNAGVIGLHTNARPLMEKVLQLTDAMLAAYQKHVMEQLAFSYFLQKEFTTRRCDDVIEHYWPFCAVAEQPMIDLFIGLEGKTIDEKIKAEERFDWSFTAEKPVKKSFWQRLFKRQ